jgi:hypothetical protein
MRKFLMACAVALAASSAWAHGGGMHAKGTLKSISADRIVLQTAEGEKAFKLSPGTQFLNGSSPATAADLHPGDRAVVHARGAEGTPEATQVRFRRKAT